MSTSSIGASARLRATASFMTELSGEVAAAARLLRAPGIRTDRNRGGLVRGAAGRPAVMLVHGLASDSSCFEVMASALHRRDFTVHAVDYSCVGTDLAGCGRFLAGEAAWLRAEVGADRVHVVAHSLGGVILRWAAANTQMGHWIHVAVTLGSPHEGAPLARLAPAGLPGLGRVIGELRPGRPGLTAPATATRWVAIAGQHDWVVPPRYARLPDGASVRNVVVARVGHLALPRSSRCLEIILAELLAAETGTCQPTAA